MRFLLFIVIPVALMLSFAGCQGHDAETEALEAQAIVLHDSLVVIENQVRGALAQVTADTVAQELATPLLDSLDVIQADLEAWSGYVVEPPGAHEDHDHDHDHSHEPPPDITPQQMVEVQQALLDEIQALKLRFDQLNIDVELVTLKDTHDDDHDHDHDDEHDDDHDHDDEHAEKHRQGVDHDH